MTQQPDLRLAFSVDHTKVSAVSYEKSNTSTQARIHGFSSVQASLFSGSGLSNLRLASDIIIDITEDLEKQTGSHFDEAAVTFASPNLQLGGHSVILPTKTERVSESDLEGIDRLWKSWRPSDGNQTVYFRKRSPFRIDADIISSEPHGLAAQTIAQTEWRFSDKKTSLLNISEVFKSAGLRISRLVPQPVASMIAATKSYEREHGVVLIDIGHEITQILCFKNSVPRYFGVFKRGSKLITNDLSVCLEIDPLDAETLKKNLICFQNENSLPGEIATARAEEIISLIKTVLASQLSNSDYKSGLVFVGAGSKLKGLLTQFRSRIHPLSKIVQDFHFQGLAETLDDTGLAGLAGLVQFESTDEESYVFSNPNKETLKRKSALSFMNLFTRA